MQILEGIPGRGAAKGPSAITVGVFDGLHLGHRALLQKCRAEADALGGPAIVISFLEHPDKLILGKAPPRIMTEEDQFQGFEEEGMDLVVRLPFDEETRNLRVESFAQDILTAGLGCGALVLGFDSAICKDREGTLEAFQALGGQLGFRAFQVSPVLVDGEPVSSSAIRAAIRRGDIPKANRLLGRPWGFEGVSQTGNKLGRELGFPTANVVPPPILLPPLGVYVAQVTVMPNTAVVPNTARVSDTATQETVRGQSHPAVLNLGMRPTLSKEALAKDETTSKRTPLCEAHLLDGPIELEGKKLRIAFLAFLREEKRFPSLEDLRLAIDKDCAKARDFFCRAQP